MHIAYSRSSLFLTHRLTAAWSPDGRHVAVVGHGPHAELCVLRFDHVTSALHMARQLQGDYAFVQWCSDNTLLLAEDVGGHVRLQLVRLGDSDDVIGTLDLDAHLGPTCCFMSTVHHSTVFVGLSGGGVAFARVHGDALSLVSSAQHKVDYVTISYHITLSSRQGSATAAVWVTPTCVLAARGMGGQYALISTAAEDVALCVKLLLTMSHL